MADVPPEVLQAFGCTGVPEKLDGGQGGSYRVGDVVFKPIDEIALYEWACDILVCMPRPGFRLATPLKSNQGAYTFAGWGATPYEPGEHVNGRWEERLRICHAFHSALKDLKIKPMPPSSDRWAKGHAIAWQESDWTQAIHPEIRQLIALRTFGATAPSAFMQG